MARLVVTYQGEKIREIVLERGTITIGRKAHNTIQLRDRTASGDHAKVVTLFRSSFIQDLCSTNGTLVNGRRIKVHTLHDGDVIHIGRHVLRFETTVPDAARPPVRDPAALEDVSGENERPEDLEVVLEGGATGSPEGGEEDTTSPRHRGAIPGEGEETAESSGEQTPDQVPVGYLRVLTGERTGEQVPVLAPVTHLGDHEGAGAVIEASAEGVFLSREDGGRHRSLPIRLNDNEIGAHACLLQHRDIVEIGGVWMEYCAGEQSRG